MSVFRKERLTEKCWRNLEPWECCGQDSYCKRGCHDKGGCSNGCIVPKLYSRLAEYEDLEERLEKMFGGKLPLEKYVDELELALKEPNSPHPINARILTYAESAKWDEYCKLEEQGLILRPPISIGSPIWDNDFGNPYKYEVTGFSYGDINDDCDFDEEVLTDELIVHYRNYNGGITGKFPISEIGKTVFLTQSEAEEKLKELERENE